jgi:hypothetical protein
VRLLEVRMPSLLRSGAPPAFARIGSVGLAVCEQQREGVEMFRNDIRFSAIASSLGFKWTSTRFESSVGSFNNMVPQPGVETPYHVEE